MGKQEKIETTDRLSAGHIKGQMGLTKRLALSLAAIAMSVACATSPKGRKQLLIMPDDQMNSMGVQAFQDLKSKQPVESNTAINSYVRCVANAITAALDGDQPKQWEVVVFKDDTANAFALPGGKIGVHTGLLKVAETPGQLAAVLGHEVGHVLARHGNERVSESFVAQGGLAAIGATLQNKGPKYDLIMAGLGMGAQFGLLLPHSRTQESEADLIGLDLMAKAGFDPKESIALWKNMEKSGGAGVPEFLSTHPSHGTRIESLQSHLGDAEGLYAKASAHPQCAR